MMKKKNILRDYFRAESKKMKRKNKYIPTKHPGVFVCDDEEKNNSPQETYTRSNGAGKADTPWKKKIDEEVKNMERVYPQNTWNLSDKLHKYWYYPEDVKEFIRRLKEESKQNRTISAAREEDCVLLETLYLIIDELAGEKLR